MSGSRAGLPASDLARTVVFAAFIAVLGIFPGIYVGGSAVPVVLQNIGPLLAGAVLGARRAVAAVVLFLALTAIGLPLLSGGRGGIGPFLGPSGGFLIGFIAAALVSGVIASSRPRPTFPLLLLGTLAGITVAYAIGVPWLGFYTGNFATASLQSLVFVPGDIAKAVVAALIASVVHRALPGTLPVAREAARPDSPAT